MQNWSQKITKLWLSAASSSLIFQFSYFYQFFSGCLVLIEHINSCFLLIGTTSVAELSTSIFGNLAEKFENVVPFSQNDLNWGDVSSTLTQNLHSGSVMITHPSPWESLFLGFSWTFDSEVQTGARTTVSRVSVLVGEHLGDKCGHMGKV